MMSDNIRVLVSDALSEDGLAILRSHREFDVDFNTKLSPADLLEVIPQYDALLVRSTTKVTHGVIKRGTRLKMIGRAGIGVDNVDVDAASAAGILVMNTPDGNVVTTAEHAISLLMSLARHVPQATASLKAGHWEKSAFKGTEIHEKTLGILGLGKIGSIVATLAKGLRMRVIAYDPVITEEKAHFYGAKLVSLDELYAHSDFISIHMPLLRDTYHFVSDSAFHRMKKGVRIINAARGGLVDERALLDALNRGHVRGAALDVFEVEPPPAQMELLQHPQVIATPHLGASTEEAQNRVALQIAEQTRDFFLKNEIRNAVNMQALH
jgi:D-3-phosphoglycerate dehydrogenase